MKQETRQFSGDRRRQITEKREESKVQIAKLLYDESQSLNMRQVQDDLVNSFPDTSYVEQANYLLALDVSDDHKNLLSYLLSCDKMVLPEVEYTGSAEFRFVEWLLSLRAEFNDSQYTNLLSFVSMHLWTKFEEVLTSWVSNDRFDEDNIDVLKNQFFQHVKGKGKNLNYADSLMA